MESIGGWAFFACDKLEDVTIADTVTSIGDNAFNSCVGVTEIKMPANLSSIGEYAFCGCNMAKITIPDGITELSEDIFVNCDSLAKVTLPNISFIGYDAFRGCGSLKDIYFAGSEEEWQEIADDSLIDVTIHCSDGDLPEDAEKPATPSNMDSLLEGVDPDHHEAVQRQVEEQQVEIENTLAEISDTVIRQEDIQGLAAALQRVWIRQVLN